MRRQLPLVLLLAATGCVRDPDPISFVEQSLAVHGLVRAGDTQVHLSLMRSPGGAALPADASVTLQTGGSAVTLAPVPDSVAQACYPPLALPSTVPHRCYGATLSRPVEAGATWHLRAAVGGDVATGSTQVPAEPAVLRPQPREHVVFSPDDFRPVAIPVQWQTPGATRVEFGFGAGRAYQGGKLVPDVACALGGGYEPAAVNQPVGTRALVLVTVYCYPIDPRSQPGVVTVAWDSVAADVLVTAYDSAYAEFALHGESVSQSSSSALQGAYGVFGSAATARREVMIVPR